MLSNIKFRMTRVIVDRSVMTGPNGMRIPSTINPSVYIMETMEIP